MANYPTSLPPNAYANHFAQNDEIVSIADEINLRHRRRIRFAAWPNVQGVGYGTSVSGQDGLTVTGTGSGGSGGGHAEHLVTSAASIGSIASLGIGDGSPYSHGSLAEAYVRCAISATTSIRFACGLNHASIADNDDPVNGGTGARYYALVQYSTGRGDTTWKFAVRDGNGTGQVLVDSGITVDTSPHWFGFRFLSSGVVRMSVDDTYSDLAFAQASPERRANVTVGVVAQAASARALSFRALSGSRLGNVA